MLQTLLVLIAAISQLPAAPPRDNRNGSARAAVSGHVTDQVSGRPIQRAIVYLHTQTTQSAGQSLEAVTDADGRYELAGLEPGEYTVVAAPPELRATYLRQAFGETVPLDVRDRPIPNLTLKAGEIRADVNIALARALAIEGRLTDEDNEPMAEVNVDLLRPDGTEYPTTPTITDDRGQFRIFGLPPGRYHVCATPREHDNRSTEHNLRYLRTCHLAATQTSAAADVLLTTEEATAIDIRAQRSRTYSVSGSVIDAGGTPADASVGAVGDQGGTSAHIVAKQGQFVLNGLAPGRYIVLASIGGPRDPGDVRPPTREQERGQMAIEVATGDVSDIVVTLSKPQTITGRVIFEGSKSRAPKGAGIVVQTSLLPRQWRLYGSRPPFSPVDDKLNFQLTGVYHFPFIVGIHGFPDNWVLKAVRFGGVDITDRPTDLAAEPRARRLEIVMTDRIARPIARVTNPDGTPTRRARVVLFPADPARWTAVRVTWPPEIDSDGRISLAAVAPGEYLLAAVNPADERALLQDPQRIKSVAPLARRVTIVENDSRVFELQVISLPARQ